MEYDALIQKTLMAASEDELRASLVQTLSESSKPKFWLDTLAYEVIRMATEGDLPSPETVVRIVSVAMDLGADPDAENPFGASLLHRACYTGHMPLARCLLAKGAAVDAPKSSLSITGETPLVSALGKMNHLMVRFLLAHGASVDPPVGAKTGPLFVAIRNNSPNMVRNLLDAGANPLMKDVYGVAPVEVAIRSVSSKLGNRLLRIVSMLVEAGVDPHVRGIWGQSVDDLAAQHPELEVALATSGAKYQATAINEATPTSSRPAAPRRI